jgi:hypothetical protein
MSFIYLSATNYNNDIHVKIFSISARIKEDHKNFILLTQPRKFPSFNVVIASLTINAGSH